MYSSTAGATFALLAIVTTPALADSAIDALVPHRAVYDVTLDEASERSGITGIKGRMVYESRGASCDGFSIRFRFFQNVRSRAREYTSDQRTTSYEAGDGTSYEFLTRTFFNGSKEREVKGSAKATEDGLAVTLAEPDARDVTLTPASFPTAHLAAVLQAARDGQRIIVRDVFDGSDDGDETMSTTAVIGRPVTEGDADVAKLEGIARWPVNVAYFSGAADASGERLPVYQVSFPLYANGVSGDLVMRYEDYTLRGELTDLEYLDAPDCAQAKD